MKMLNKGFGRIALIMGILIVIGAGIVSWYLAKHAGQITTDDAYVAGRVHTIAAKINGTVLKVNIKDNQTVKKGDVLVEIDSTDYDLKVQEAQAGFEAENARLLDVEAGIKTAQANLEIQNVNLRQAQLDKTRAQTLYKQEVIAKEKYEKAATAYDFALAQVNAAKEQLEKTKTSKDFQESLIQQKRVLLKIAQRNLEYVKIIAPADGYVSSKTVESGNQIQIGQPLMAIVALDDIWLQANYKETQVKTVQSGQHVDIKVDAYPGKLFSGTVDSIMAGTGAVFSLFPPENALGNYVKVVQRVPIKIIFDKSISDRYVLRIGMSCVPTIITNNNE